MNLMVASALLKATEIHIDTATGGGEALHRIQARKGGRNPKTPVICLTADAVIGAKERYMAEGFTDYLTKPIDSQALERMLIAQLPADKVTLVRADAPRRAILPPCARRALPRTSA